MPLRGYPIVGDGVSLSLLCTYVGVICGDGTRQVPRDDVMSFFTLWLGTGCPGACCFSAPMVYLGENCVLTSCRGKPGAHVVPQVTLECAQSAWCHVRSNKLAT